MVEVCREGMGEIYTSMAYDQDRIRWRCFMEGMVCKKFHSNQVLVLVYTMIEGKHTRHERNTMDNRPYSEMSGKDPRSVALLKRAGTQCHCTHLCDHTERADPV